MKPAECSGRPKTLFLNVWFLSCGSTFSQHLCVWHLPHTIQCQITKVRLFFKNHERINSKLFALCFPCVCVRSKPCCNTQKYHQMAPLGKSCFASWFPSSDVYSKHSLVKCLWKREENLLWGRKNTNDKTALALSWILVYRVKLWLLLLLNCPLLEADA